MEVEIRTSEKVKQRPSQLHKPQVAIMMILTLTEPVHIASHDAVAWKSTDQGFRDDLRSGDYILQWRGRDYKVNGEMQKNKDRLELYWEFYEYKLA
ncbi:hypothetical protein QD46_25320 [Paenibacillus polymyxa]|nr:hypothetical protein QD46_25320 [Paenibacillus polymyxa]